MKERSIIFYKRLIVFSALSIIIIVACLLVYFVGNKIGFQDIKPMEDAVPTANENIENKAIKSNIEEENKSTEVSTSERVINNSKKVVYLTFDDGSSNNTLQILEILKKHNIKSTFFFNTSSQTTDSIIKEAYDNGHAVGVLTSTNYNYDGIYSSVENYLKDFDESYNRIYQITGQKPSILRFPGGSINAFNKDNYTYLIDEIVSRGLVYFDWNVCANDGTGEISKEAMVINATKLPRRPEKCIVLMHDNGNANTCLALEEIIHFYEDNGYDFQKLTSDVKPITF